MSLHQTRRTISEPTSRVTRFNDNTLELLIAVWRGLSMAGQIAWASTFVIATGTGGTWWWISLACAVVALLFGWLGFWRYGNPEWHDGAPSPGDPS